MQKLWGLLLKAWLNSNRACELRHVLFCAGGAAHVGELESCINEWQAASRHEATRQAVLAGRLAQVLDATNDFEAAEPVLAPHLPGLASCSQALCAQDDQDPSRYVVRMSMPLAHSSLSHPVTTQMQGRSVCIRYQSHSERLQVQND